LEQYIKKLQGCGIVIMNHYKQQAVGNILMMLWLGSKVYLNESNTIYHYLKRIGIKIFSIDNDLIRDNHLALMNLSQDEIDQNRSILKKTIGEEHVIKGLKDSVLNFFS